MRPNRTMFDLEPAITLFDDAGGPYTVATPGNVVDLGRDKAYWQEEGVLPYTAIVFVCHATNLDFTDTDEQYTLAIEVDVDLAFGSPQTIVQVNMQSDGIYKFIFEPETLELLLPGVRTARATITPSGTTPSIDLCVFASFVDG